MATKSTTVLLLCGLPGSGKSELARQIITQEQRSDAHRRGACVWIEYDSIQQQLQLEKSSCSSCSSSLEAWRRTRQVALDKLKEELLERNDDDDEARR
jgi:predicted kinase